MLLQGQVPVDEIVTHQLPLARYREGFELVAAAQRSIKVMLVP